ncbi:hypothetical protein MMB232_03186 [Brevundimonas subvibrioides]|uniref:glycosyltransferase family 61 protein n=1 Tax=Brevundimonas subvibrioides TaxID=74313 RepID=UPI0032D5A1E1
MDISELLGGFRNASRDEHPAVLERKITALELSHTLRQQEGDFETFLEGVPDGLLNAVLSSDGVDTYLTTLLASALHGHLDADVFLAAVVHGLVLQLTYQGRHRPWPEAYVLGAGGDMRIGAIGLLNTGGVPAFVLDPHFEAGSGGDQKTLALSAAVFTRAAAGEVPTILAATIQKIGCVAFLDLGRSCDGDGAMVRDVAAMTEAVTKDTFYMFAGQAGPVSIMHRWIAARHPSAKIDVRYYWQSVGRSAEFKGVIVVTGVDGCLDLQGGVARTETSYLIRTAADLARDLDRDDIFQIVVREHDRVNLREPTVISSSAPLPEEQAIKISDPLDIRHVVLKTAGGRVIRELDGHRSTYVIVTGKGEIIEDYQEPGAFHSSPHFVPVIDGEARLSTPHISRPARQVAGTSLLLTFHPLVHTFHSHFLLQCFPRIELMKALGIEDYSILVPHDIKKYQIEMLGIAGIEESRLVRMNPDYDYIAEILVTPILIPAVFTPLYAEVYSTMIAKVGVQEIKPYRRIIISREARTTWRNMLNFDAIAQRLVERHGFELVWPDKLSIEDEIRLFRESEIVVGAEGAGLYNCCFMSAGSHVVCLADQDYVMYIVASMAHIRGFDVSYVFGESFMAESDRARRAGHSNFVVDPERVSAAIAEILDQRARPNVELQ